MTRCTETSVVLRDSRDRNPPSKDQVTKTAVPISVAQFVQLSQSGDLPDTGDDEFLKPKYRVDLSDQSTEIAQNVLNRPVYELTKSEKDAVDKLVEMGWKVENVKWDSENRVVPYKPLRSEIEITSGGEQLGRS